jgi:hypothetical protein
MSNAFAALRGITPRLPCPGFHPLSSSRTAKLYYPRVRGGAMAAPDDVDLFAYNDSYYTATIPVRPFAIANPFPNQVHLPFDYPAGLMYVVTALHYAVASSSTGCTGAIAVCWNYRPTSGTGTATIDITFDGTSVYSITLQNSDGPQSGTYWVSDAIFDSASWPQPVGVTTVTGSGAWRIYTLTAALGGLVTDVPPTGWTAVTEEEPPELPIGPDLVAFLDSGYHPRSQAPEIRCAPTFPATLATSSRRGAISLRPAYKYGIGGDWGALRGASAAINAGFPTIYTDSGAFETLDIPEFFDAGPGRLVTPSRQGWWDTQTWSGRGCIFTINEAYADTPDTTDALATWIHGCDQIALQAVSGMSSAGSYSVQVKEWESGNIVHSSTITGPWTAGQIVPLALTSPGVAAGAPWRLKCVIHDLDGSGYSDFVLRFRPLYGPWPWAVPRADAAGVVPGGYNATSTRAVTSHYANAGADDATLAAGVLTHTFGAPTASGPVTLTFAPAKGWYAADQSSGTLYGEGEASPAYSPTTCAASCRGNGLPFRWVLPSSPASGTVRSISRRTPSPQAIDLGSSSWLQLGGGGNNSNGLMDFASFTAPSDGTYAIEVVVSDGTPDTAANRWGQLAEVWASLTDADVIDGATLLMQPLANPLTRAALSVYASPALVSDLRTPGVVNLSPSGAFVGHEGQIFDASHAATTDGTDWIYYAPEDGLVAALGTLRQSRGGAWPTDPVVATITALAGQTVTLRLRLVNPNNAYTNLTTGSLDARAYAGTYLWVKARAVT